MSYIPVASLEVRVFTRGRAKHVDSIREVSIITLFLLNFLCSFQFSIIADHTDVQKIYKKFERIKLTVYIINLNTDKFNDIGGITNVGDVKVYE